LMLQAPLKVMFWTTKDGVVFPAAYCTNVKA
jgi:hypothetical protein